MSTVSPPPAPAPPSTGAAFAAIYRLILRSQTTRGRTLALVALGVAFLLVCWNTGTSEPVPSFDNPDPRPGIDLLAFAGLPLVAPIIALMFAAAALGDPTEDGTMVYLWLRPVPRWVIAVAAVAASLTVTLPLVVPALTIGAALTDEGTDLTVGTAIASVVAVLAYTPLFVALGLRAKRAVLWGLAFILIWETFITAASDGIARLSVSRYAASIVAEQTDVPIERAVISMPTAVIVPLLVGVLATIYTARRLRRQDID